MTKNHKGQFDILSQYLSIVSSTLVILKTAIELLSFERSKEEVVDDSKNERTEEQKTIFKKLLKILRKIVSFSAWVPLIFIRKVFKIGFQKFLLT